MKSQKNNETKSNLMDQYDDITFKLAMLEYAEREGKELLKENARLVSENLYSPTNEDDVRFEKCIAKSIFKHQFKDFLRSSRKFLKFCKKPILTALAVLVLTFSVTFASSASFREIILNFFANIYTEYMEIGAKSYDASNVDWGKGYYPSYMPDGFVLSDIQVDADGKRALFTSQEDDSNTIFFYECSSELAVRVDSENSNNIITTKIGDLSIVILEKDGFLTANCVDSIEGRAFYIQSTLTSDELLKILKKVKFIS